MTIIKYKPSNGYAPIPAQVVTVTYPPEKLGFGIGTCSTAADTVAKTATIQDFELTENAQVSIKFQNAISVNNATLNISTTGAKAIYYNGNPIQSGVIKAGMIANMVYDGTNYVIVSLSDVVGDVVSNISYDITNKKLTKTVNGTTSDIVTVATIKSDLGLTKSDVGLGNVDNTSDVNKPISTATQTALDGKVDNTTTVNGHALNSNVTVTKGDLGLDNVGNFKAVSTEASQGLTTTEQSNARSNIGAGVPQIQSDWTQTDNTSADYIKNKPTLADVATSGSYTDLDNIPSNITYFSSDSGVGIVPSDGIKAETVAAAATLSVNPDVVTVISGSVGTSAMTLQVPNDNLAHVWDILMTTGSAVNVTLAMSNGATIKVPPYFSIIPSKAIELSIVGVGSTYYLRYGEFA